MSRNANYARRKGRDNGLPFIQILHYVYDCPAYRDLDTVARCLYAALRRRYNGRNNGAIALGCRDAAAEMNVAPRTITRAFRDLEQHGFVRIAADSSFHQKRLAREWLLTDVRDDRSGAAGTKDFMRWVPSLEASSKVQIATVSNIMGMPQKVRAA